jgi:multidrug efflux pump subunit AcrA (membrane-fusion protein)
MERILRIFVTLLCIILALIFIINTFRKSSQPPTVAPPPKVNDAPARVYGSVEPAGREVFVSPTVTRRVIQIFVREGDTVQQGDILCILENSVEMAQYHAALAKVESARTVRALSEDTLKRNKDLYENKVLSDYDYTQARLREEVDSVNFEVAVKEAKLAKAQLEQLTLKSPIDGKVYKFDVRLGESLTANDNTRIILGPKELWVRLYVESYWIDRIKKGDKYNIYDSETLEYIGMGQVLYKAPYLGGREFRTEDVRDRADIKFQEVVLRLKSEKQIVPIGLSVVAELFQENNR